MPPLGAKERAQLPDRAFAYIDSRGKRRLPINDAAHVRNALARFSQVAFEDEEVRDRARTRLLRAAQKHGIVPIGFISAELQPQRKLPRGRKVTWQRKPSSGCSSIAFGATPVWPCLKSKRSTPVRLARTQHPRHAAGSHSRRSVKKTAAFIH